MSVEQAVATLREVPTFAALPDEALRILAVSAEEMTLNTGEALFRAGEPADGGYVVMSGRIELTQDTPSRAYRSLELLSGALIGESALLIPVKRPAAARALEASRLLRIPRTTFVRMLDGFPDAALILRDALAARIQTTLGELDGLRRARLDTPPR